MGSPSFTTAIPTGGHVMVWTRLDGTSGRRPVIQMSNSCLYCGAFVATNSTRAVLRHFGAAPRRESLDDIWFYLAKVLND